MSRPALVATLLPLLLLAACSKPAAPDKDKPVEPQAARHDTMRKAIDAPLQKARDVEATLAAAKQAQDAAIDAASDAAPAP